MKITIKVINQNGSETAFENERTKFNQGTIHFHTKSSFFVNLWGDEIRFVFDTPIRICSDGNNNELWISEPDSFKSDIFENTQLYPIPQDVTA